MRTADKRFAALLMTPAALFLLAFVAWPLVRLVHDSFFDISPLSDTSTFIGFGNYTAALGSTEFQAAAVRTVVYTAIVVSAEFVMGLAAALLFSALGRRSALFRTVFMYPLMIAPVVAGLLWRFLLIDNSGIVGHILAGVGILSSPNETGWLSNPNIVLLAVAIPDIWLTTAFMTLVLFAGLQNIPAELIEASRLDGAGFWTMLWRVIIPLLRPVIAVALIVRGIDAAKAFDIILIQTGGGPQNASTTLSLLIYRTMIRFGEPGLASAMATMFLIVMLMVAAVAVATIWRPGADR
jgi:multiple sugar transport system permease protein